MRPIPEEAPPGGAEGLHLIRQMISAAKDEHRERGDGWLLWGWLLFGASGASIALYLGGGRAYIGWVWTGMLIAGLAIGLSLYLWKGRSRVPEVQTYSGRLLDRLGTGFFVSLLVMVAASWITGQSSGFGYYYVLYAFWMFIYGSALSFRPLLYGAVVNWAAALLIFYMDSFLYTMIISAVAVGAGYLVPGYLLRAQYHQSARRGSV